MSGFLTLDTEEPVLSSSSRFWRAFLALFAVATLVAACGGDDSDAKSSSDDTEESDDTGSDSGSDDSSDDSSDDESDDESSLEDPCSLLDPQDLTDVTGIEFDSSDPGENSCTYSSSEGAAAIALNFADLEGADPADAIEAAQSSCDEGTVVELEFSDSDGGFGCLVNGVPTVAATGDGIFAVLTGATLDTSVDTDQILQDLATILENAITGG